MFSLSHVIRKTATPANSDSNSASKLIIPIDCTASLKEVVHYQNRLPASMLTLDKNIFRSDRWNQKHS